MSLGRGGALCIKHFASADQPIRGPNLQGRCASLGRAGLVCAEGSENQGPGD